MPECFLYLERKGQEGFGNGWCLGEHDSGGKCKLCEKVMYVKCPRGHRSPYLKEGERT